MFLLLDHDSDPTIKGTKSQTPYSLCKNAEIRLALRKFAGKNPTKWKYTFPILTPEMEAEALHKKKMQKKMKKMRQKKKRQQKKAEKQAQRKLEEEKKMKREKEEKESQMIKKSNIDREHKIKSLTPRELRAQAAERRFAAQKGSGKKCDNPDCKKFLVRIPFGRLDYKYCTMVCLRSHKEQLNDPKYY